MPKPLLFRARRTREVAAYALALSARWSRSSKTILPPVHPERLGNLLQRLALQRPAVVFVIENIVVEILKQLDR